MVVKFNAGSNSTASSNATTSGGRPSVSISTEPARSLGVKENVDVVRDALSLTELHSDVSGMNPLPETSGGKISLDISINNYRPVDSQGFSEQRPEIIAQFDFEPAFDGSSQSLTNTPVSDFIDVQTSAISLRIENTTKLLDELRADERTKPIIEELEKRANVANSQIENELKFLFELDASMTDAKRALCIKRNSDFIKSDVSNRDASATLSIDPLKDVFINVLGFSEESYASFTDTKLLAQLLEDLFNIIKSYSPVMTSRIDPSRLSDLDPYSVNRYDDASAGVINALDVATLKSTTNADLKTIVDRSAVDTFNFALKNLQSFDDKLKTIIAVLSRELRVSAGLSNQSVRSSITNAFGLTNDQIDSNVFDRIIGRPGSNIFEPASVGVRNSMANLLRVESSQNIVFPFETHYIKHAGAEMIPGQKFYVDSILRGVKKFDATAFINYASVFSSSSRALATIVEGTLDVNVLNNERLGLNGDDILDQLLVSIKTAVDSISSKSLGPLSFFTDQQPSESRDTFTPALLAAAADDPLLKHMLTLYITLAGVKNAYQPGGPDGIFKAIVSLNNEQNVSQNPASEIESEINRLLSDVRIDPVSKYGSQQRGSDDVTRLTAGSDPATPGHGMDVLASAIVARLLDIEASSNPPRSTQAGNETYDNISEFRIYDKLSTLGAGDPNFLLKSIVDNIVRLDAAARNASTTEKYYTKEGLTRFNNVGLHTLIRLYVELYTSFFKAFPIATFSGATTTVSLGSGGKEFSVRRDDTLISELKEALRLLCQTSGLRPTGFSNTLYLDDDARLRGTRTQTIVDRFTSIKSKFTKDDEVIKKIVNILLAVGNALGSASTNISRFFSQAGPNASFIKSLSEQTDIDSKMAALDNMQVTVMRNFAQQYSENSTKQFVQSIEFNDGVQTALSSMLKDTECIAPAALNKKIISVGLPVGFFDSLNTRLGSFAGNDYRGFAEQASARNDLIKIHVYMKDLLFDDVVFKPQSFVFQLGRFVGNNDFSTIQSTNEFSRVIETATTRILATNASAFEAESLDAKNFATNTSYEGILTSQQKVELAKNHVKSYLLSVYVKLLTGIDLVEDAFYVNDSVADLRVDQETQAIFQRLIETRVSSFVGRKVTLKELADRNKNVRDMLTRLTADGLITGIFDPIGEVFPELDQATNVEISEDLLSFMNVFSPRSLLIGSGARRIRVTSPKLFERIFNVIVDPDDFEIDLDVMSSTESGRAFITTQIANRLFSISAPQIQDASRMQLNSLTPVKFNQSVRREMGNLALQQFFVVVEQLPERTLSVSTQNIRGNVLTPRQEDIEKVVGQTRVVSSRNVFDAIPANSEGLNWSKLI